MERGRHDLQHRKSMKIIQLFKIYWPDNGGGIAKVMEQIAEGFPTWDQEIIVCQDSRKKKRTDDRYKSIAVHRCSQIFNLMSTPVSLQYLWDMRKRTKDSDIVIYHFPYPMVDLAVLLGMYSGRLVVWWHCGFEKYQKLGFFYRPLVRNTLKKADRILVSSQGNIENSDILKCYQKKCRVIPYCVSNECLQRGLAYVTNDNEKKDKKSQICILFVGRLVWYKGCDVLLKAFARMRRNDCRLVLVGGGPLERKLKALAASFMLNNVVFTGMISEEEKLCWLEQCDFLVLPSISKAEAFAVVQLEAMAFGKPVINTALKSGVPYVSVDGVTGITVKPGSVSELTAAMERLASDERLRRKYGANAFRMVQEKYTQDLMVKRHRRLFQKLAGAQKTENRIVSEKNTKLI